jgi:hypothetical protein
MVWIESLLANDSLDSFLNERKQMSLLLDIFRVTMVGSTPHKTSTARALCIHLGQVHCIPYTCGNHSERLDSPSFRDL